MSERDDVGQEAEATADAAAKVDLADSVEPDPQEPESSAGGAGFEDPPEVDGLEALKRRKVSIEVDERTLLWAVLAVLSLLVVVEGFSIIGLRSRVKGLEGGGAVGSAHTATGGSAGTVTGSDEGGTGQVSAPGWGSPGATGSGGSTSDGLDAPGPGTGAGDSGSTTGETGAGAAGEPGAGGWAATDVEGPSAEPPAAVGGTSGPDNAATMQRLEAFIAAQGIDAVAGDSLRNLVGESLVVIQDIESKAMRGEISQVDRQLYVAKEGARVKAALQTLLGDSQATSLETSVLLGG